MTARPQENVVNNIALLPLPDVFYDAYDNCVDEDVLAYARANVTAALASAQAREDELRAEVERLKAEADSGLQSFDAMYALVRQYRHRTERLEEALRAARQKVYMGELPHGWTIDRIDAALSTNAATQTGETNA